MRCTCTCRYRKKEGCLHVWIEQSEWVSGSVLEVSKHLLPLPNHSPHPQPLHRTFRFARLDESVEPGYQVAILTLLPRQHVTECHRRQPIVCAPSQPMEEASKPRGA